jgi:drug/metabolite transporter (DMT)-like permease
MIEKTQQTRKSIAVLLAAAGVILFSSKAVWVKKAYQFDVDPLNLLFIRMAFALPVYIVIAIFSSRHKKGGDRLTRKQIFALVLLGFGGYYLSSFLDFTGLKYITASLERLILFVYPTLVVLISAMLYRQPVPRRQIWAIVVTYLGILLVFYEDAGVQDSVNKWLGPLLIFGCSLTYASYLVGSGQLIPKIGSVRFTSYAMIVSTCAVILHVLIAGNIKVFHYSSDVYEIGIGLAVIATLLPSFMISEAINRLGASSVAIIGSIGPVSTIILASIFLGERLNALQWLGAVIVIAGVVMVNIEKSRKVKVKSETKRMDA